MGSGTVGRWGGVLLAQASPDAGSGTPIPAPAADAPPAAPAADMGPLQSLSPELRTSLDSKKLSANQLRWLGKALQEYRFQPASPADIDALTDGDNLWILSQPSTKAFFEFCRTNFGYAFEVSFLDDVRRVVDMNAFHADLEILQAAFLSRALGQGLLGQEAGDIEGEFRKASETAFTRRMEIFQSLIAPEDVVILSDVVRRSGGAFAIEGLRYYRARVEGRAEAFRMAVQSARFDPGRLAAIAGGGYSGDAFLLALASSEHPDILDRLDAAVGQLHPQAGRLTKEAVDFVGAFRGDERLAGIVGWIGANFGIGFTLDRLSRLSAAVAVDSIEEVTEDAIGALAADPASGARVKGFLGAHGLAFDPFRLHYYLWPPEAVASYERYREAYGIQPLNDRNIGSYWNYFVERMEDRKDDPCLRPEVVKVARAMLENGGIISAEEDGTGTPQRESGREMNDVVEAVATVLAYEKELPKTAGVLGRLADAGVVIKRDELQYGIRAALPLFQTLAEDAALLGDVEALLRVMPSLKGRMPLRDVIDFVGLPTGSRKNLTHPPMGRFIEFLCERYDLKPDYQDAKLVALQEEGSPLRDQIPWLQSPEAMAFYAANRDLFAERGKEGAGHGADVIALILALFLRSKGDPKILGEARRWREVMGRAVDQIFLLSYEGGKTRFLHHPGIGPLADAAEKLGVREALMGNSSLITRFLPHRKILASGAFQTFYREVPKAFGFDGGSVYDLDEALDLYRDAAMRKFLSRPEVRAFAAKLRGYGFAGGWGTFGQLKRLFEHPGTIDDLKRFADAYGIDLAREIRKVQGLAHSPGLMLMGGIEGSFGTKGFDFFEEYLAMTASGDFALLLGEEAAAASAHLKTTVGYALRLLDLSTFVTFLKTKRTKEYLLGDAFSALWNQLKARVPDLKFWLSDADVFMNLGQHAQAAFDVLEGLKRAYGFELKGDRDLSLVADLAANRPAFDRLVSPAAAAVVAELKEKHRSTFELANMWAIVFLADHPEMLERLYRDDIDALARRLSSSIPGNDIAERLELAQFLDDPINGEKFTFVSSEAFRETLQRLARYNGRQSLVAGVDEIDGVFKAHRTPELFRLLDGIGYRPSWAMAAEPLMAHLPELAAFARQPDAVALVKGLQGMGSPRCRYWFHPADGAALLRLLEGRSVPEVKRMAAPLFRQSKGNLTVNDILYAIERKSAFVADRKKLEAGIAAGFADDVHRMDSNFDGYTSYNIPSAFSLVDLNKMAELRGWLMRPETRGAIGAIIDRDIAQYPASELGGAILIGGGPELFEGEPLFDFQNGSYRMPQGIIDRLSRSIAMYHLHATSRHDGLKAGPSGTRFLRGGDISFSERHAVDGIVITSLDEQHFCVHFYDDGRNVTFLGTYDIPSASP